jgi:lipoyl(octanoyl) transferase
VQYCKFLDLGLKAYGETRDLQLELFNGKIEQKQRGEKPVHHLIFVEHPHVYTLGKSGEMSNLLADETRLKLLGAEVFKIERGGDITYHGPGQLVAYPIFDLEQLKLGVKSFVEGIENSIIQTLKQWDIESGIIKDRIGVWVDIGKSNERKIAAIGIKCSRFVSMHGLALNVNSDLQMFGHIVPCGIVGKDVTSIEKEVQRQIDMIHVKNELGKQFAVTFGLKFENETQ